ncbi:serine/threonine-protein kinase fray2-like [Rhipicephalus sanguineus]|uniref:serine/threonine-protein kinase fray2-like n=1 Tax=Rhipicephalus sanguineus TaxID=34632 RepID=UPI0020C55A68|nr:serine/threonine-protein kinase fray2-like [Rhipicephalus sanguineus]
MPVHEQEAKYAAITAQYGAPAYRSGQDLSTATCFNCRQLGHLAARCPSPRATRQRLPDNTHPHATAMSCLEGSLVQCAVIEAHVAGVGTVDAFPDSGSKITILTEDLVPSSALTPWKKPPLSVVGGGTGMPAGTLSTSISLGPISAVVDVTVLPRNPLPLILGEDWFQAAQAELIVKPPKPTEIHHPSTNTALFCLQKLFPRMANAVFLHSQPLFASTQFTTGGLQLEPIPDNNRPPSLSLACHEALFEKGVKDKPVELPHCSASSTTDETSSLLREAQISQQLSSEESTVSPDRETRDESPEKPSRSRDAKTSRSREKRSHSREKKRNHSRAKNRSLSPEKKRSKSRERRMSRSRDRSRRSKERKRRRTRKKERSPSREKTRNRHREKRSHSRDKRRSRSREKNRSISRDGRRSRSRDQRRSRARKRPSRIRDRRRNRNTRPRSRSRPRRSWTRAMLLQSRRSAEQLRNKSNKSPIVPVARAVIFVSPEGLTTTTSDAASSHLRHCHKPRHQPHPCAVFKTFSCAEHYDHGTWSPKRGWDVRCQPSHSVYLPCLRTDGSTHPIRLACRAPSVSRGCRV